MTTPGGPLQPPRPSGAPAPVPTGGEPGAPPAGPEPGEPGGGPRPLPGEPAGIPSGGAPGREPAPGTPPETPAPPVPPETPAPPQSPGSPPGTRRRRVGRAERPPAWTAGPGGAPAGGSTGGSAGDAEPAGPPPEDIRSAWGLWLAATVFALLGALLNAATTRYADLPVATRDAFRSAVESAGDSAGVSVEGLFTVTLGLGAGLALLASAVTVWLAFRLRASRGWARTMLDIVAIFLVIDAVSVVIGVFGGVADGGQRGEVVTFVVFSLQILAGLCAATAVWRQHTAEATAFLLRGGGARAGE